MLSVFAPLLLLAETVRAQVDPIYTRCGFTEEGFCLRVGDDDSLFFRLTPNSPQELVASWSFDSLYPVDESGNRNNLHPGHEAGPGVNFMASAAFSREDSFLSSSPSKIGLAGDFTIAFWLHPLPQSSAATSVLALDDGLSVLLAEQVGTSNLRVLVTSGATGQCSRESHGLKSLGPVPTGTWHHIVIIRRASSAELYVNAYLSSSRQVTREAFNATLRLGQSETCPTFRGYLDNLVIYSKAFQGDEIVSLMSPPAVLGMEAITRKEVDFVSMNTTADVARQACSGTWELCSAEHLASMNFRKFLRTQGLLQASVLLNNRTATERGLSDAESRRVLVWTSETLNDGINPDGSMTSRSGMLFCCRSSGRNRVLSPGASRNEISACEET